MTQLKYLLDSSQNALVLTNFPYQLSGEDPSDSNLLPNLATLLYQIITIYPAKYYKTQAAAISSLETEQYTALL